MKNLVKEFKKMREFRKMRKEYKEQMELLGTNEENIKILDDIYDNKVREFVQKYY